MDAVNEIIISLECVAILGESLAKPAGKEHN